jgi:hypothetical protein
MREKGQGLVELAITLPIFIIVLVGLFEVGWAIINYQRLSIASREAARVATKICTLNWEGSNFEEIRYTTVYTQMMAASGKNVLDETGYFAISLFEISPYGDVVSSPLNVPHWAYGNGSQINVQDVVDKAVDEQVIATNFLIQNDPTAVPLRHRFVVVEVGYDHYQLLGFPLIANKLTNPIPFYVKTVMRYNESRDVKKEDLSELCGW